MNTETLKKILQPVNNELIMVENEIAAEVKISRHIGDFERKLISGFVGNNGKMLRPALLLLSVKAADPFRQNMPDEIIRCAAAIELVHSASLIHDDVLDGSPERRNRKSVNSEFGNRTAVLTGDILNTAALGMILKNGGVKTAELILDAISTMCRGEITCLINPDYDETAYQKIIHDKTAKFMSVCCRAGAELSVNGISAADALAEYGVNLGYAFQLMDDYHDRDLPETVSIEKNPQMASDFILAAKESLNSLEPNIYTDALKKLADSVINE